MYDLYLNRTFNKLPEMSELLQGLPIVVDVELQKRLFQRSSPPNVLGLKLSKDLAKRLLERCLAFGSNGYYFPADYHQPRISIEQATIIASQSIEKEHLETDPTDTVGSIFQSYTYPCFWSFGAISERMTKEGRIPNAIFACVDKLDGHVWQKEELDLLWRGVLFDN